MANIFTADLHHMHKNICKYTDRGLCTTQEGHDEWLVDVWNNNVTKQDVCWCLGDFSFSRNVDEVESFLKRLNGIKHLIKGNHDDRKVLGELKKRNAISWWGDYKEIKIGGIPTVLFHFSISNWHKQHHGSLHLHGHSHGSFQPTDGKILDVGLDSAYNIFGRHKFFTEEDVLEYMQKRSMHVADQHVVRTGEM